MTSTAGTAPGEPDALQISEVARRTGLSTDTLRYYERAGLLQPVGRTAGGQRRYAAGDLDWLAFLMRLRDTGMPIAEMRRFADLRRAGSSTVPERIALLSAHRDELRQRIAAQQTHLAVLDAKITHYEGLRAPQPETEPR